MKRIYIAGPMRGLPDFNFPAFDKAEASLRKWGWDVVNPAQMDRNQASTGACGPEPDIRNCMARDLQAITECDAIALLPGWELSSGARTEATLALMLDLEFDVADTGDDIDKAEIHRVLASYHMGEFYKHRHPAISIFRSVAVPPRYGDR